MLSGRRGRFLNLGDSLITTAHRPRPTSTSPLLHKHKVKVRRTGTRGLRIGRAPKLPFEEHVRRQEMWIIPKMKNVKPYFVEQVPMEPTQASPHVFCKTSSNWVPVTPPSQTPSILEYKDEEATIKVVSWNVEGLLGIGTKGRINAAIDHIRDRFGESPGHLVVMLQEVIMDVIDSLKAHSWVQANFVISNLDTPEPVVTDLPGDGFVMRSFVWQPAHYFTIMMVSRTLPLERVFHVPFTSQMGRDALVVDIRINDPKHETQETRNLNSKTLFRLCTTHLEPHSGGPGMYRLGQLTRIAGILRGNIHPPGTDRSTNDEHIIGGLVGGDMNSFPKDEQQIHKSPGVDLKDAWEDITPPATPVLKPGKKDLTFGRDRGNTWGYQSYGRRERKRIDKFFYKGCVELVALVDEAQDVVGKVGRLGVGLKAEAEVWQRPTWNYKVKKGELVKEEGFFRIPDRMAESGGRFSDGCSRVKEDIWVSDHFGITVGIRLSSGGSAEYQDVSVGHCGTQGVGGGADNGD